MSGEGRGGGGAPDRLDEMLDALRAEGRVDSRGRFTLDREKARDKMQRFQLAEPLHYLLLLVEAAVLKGATRLQFDIDTDDVHLRFDGAPFTLKDFDRLYEALLGEDDGASEAVFKARQALAIGLNAAAALEPVFIRVQSGDGEVGARLEMEQGKREEFGELYPAPEGTHLHLKEAASSVGPAEMFRWMTGQLAEVEILREKCRYAQCEIVVNGKDVARGLFVPGAVVGVPVMGEGFEGVAALRDTDEAPSVDLVKDGVWITTHTLEDAELPRGFVATVQSGGLTKDVSQRNVLLDETWARIVEGLRASRGALWRMWAHRYETTERPPPWLKRRLLGALVAQEAGALDAVARVPLWPTHDGGTITTAAVVARIESGDKVGYVSEVGGDAPPIPGHPFVLSLDEQHRRALSGLSTQLAGSKVTHIDVSEALEAARARARREARWRERRTAPTLGEGWYAVKVPVEGEGITGEMALRDAGQDWISVQLVVDGCLLGERTAPCELPGVVVVVEAPLTPDEDFTWVKQTGGVLRDLTRALGGALVRLMEALAEIVTAAPARHAGEREILLRYLGATRAWDHTFAEVLGVEAGGGRERPAKLALSQGGALARCPLAEDLRGGWRSLADFRALRADDRLIRWVRHNIAHWPAARDKAEIPEGVRLDHLGREALKQAFGRGALSQASDEYLRAYWRRAHLQKAQWKDLEPDREVVAQVPVEGVVKGKAVVGTVALVRPRRVSWFWAATSDASPPITLRVLRDMRSLCTLQITPEGLLGKLPPLLITIDTEAVTPTPNWTGVVEDTGLAGALRVVGEAVSRLIAKLAGMFDARGQDAGVIREALQVAAVAALSRGGASGLPGFPTREGGGEVPTEALLACPLMSRVTAEGRAAPLTIAEARAAAQKDGTLYVLSRPRAMEAIEGAVVPLVEAEARWVEAIFGADALVDAGPWLELRQARRDFMARPQRPLHLEAERAIAQVEIDVGEVSGVVGLSTSGPDEGWVDVLVEGRLLRRLTPPGLRGINGVLQIPEYLVEARFDGVTDQGLSRITKAVLANREALFEALAAAVAAGEVKLKAPRVRAHILEALIGARGTLKALLDVPLFEDLAGERWSASGLKAHLTVAQPQIVDPGFPVPRDLLRPSDLATWVDERAVIRADGRVRQALTSVFGGVTPVASTLEELAAAHERQRTLPEVGEPPAEAVAVRHMSWSGGAGWVALLPPTTPTLERRLALSRHGRVVDRIEPHPHLPFAGMVSGAGVKVERTWRHAEASKELTRRCLAEAVELYAELVERFDALPEEARGVAREVLVGWLSAAPSPPEPPELPRGGADVWRRAVKTLPLVGHALYPTVAEAVAAGAPFHRAVTWESRVQSWRLRQVTVPVALPGRPEAWAGGPVRAEWAGGHGVLGVESRRASADGPPPPGRDIEIHLLWQERLLQRKRVSSPVGPFSAVVSDEALMPDLSLERVAPGPRLDEVIEQVRAHIPALIEGVAQGEMAREDHFWMMGALRAYVPDHALLKGLGWLLLEADQAGVPEAEPEALRIFAALVEAIELHPDFLSKVARKRSAQGLREALEAGPEVSGAPWPLLAADEGGLRIRPLPVLLGTPLFTCAGPTVAGEPTRRSLMTLARVFAEQGALLCATPMPCEFEPDRLVLTPEAGERELLERLFERRHLEEATAWLKAERRKWALSARPVERVALDEGRALVKRAIGAPERTGPGMDGEVGLSAGFRLGQPEAEHGMQLYKERRSLGSVEAPQPGMIVAIDDNRLTLDDDLESVARNGDFDRVVRRCSRERNALIQALVEAWEGFDESQRRTALHHILYTLSRQGRHRALQTEAGRAVSELPCLLTVNGRWITLQQAARSRAREGALLYMPRTAPADERPVDPERLVVLAVEPEVQEALQGVFGATEDYTERWIVDQAAHARRAACPPLRPPPDEALLWLHPLTPREHGLEGALYLPLSGGNELATLTLGGDGLAVSEGVACPGSFPVYGALSGPRVEVDEGWRSARLGDGGRRAVSLAARNLYEDLAEAFRRWLAEEDPRAEPAREALLEVALRCRASSRNGQLDRATARFYNDTLSELPLLWPRGDSRVKLSAVTARSTDSVVEQLRGWSRFARGEVLPPRLPREVWARSPIEGARVGEIGVPRAHESGVSTVSVRYLGRPLVESRMSLSIGPVVAVIHDDTLMPDASWSGVERGMEAVDAAVWAAVGPLVVNAIERLGEGTAPSPGVGNLIYSATRLLAPEPEILRWAATRLHALEGDVEALAAEWVKLHQLGLRRGWSALTKALRERFEHGLDSPADQLWSLVKGGQRDERGDALPGGDDFVKALIGAPAWPAAGGLTSLMSLCAGMRGGGPVLFVEGSDRGGAPEGEGLVYLVQGGNAFDHSLDQLRRLFGDHLTPMAAWLVEEAARARFEARPQVDEIAPEPEQVLVEVAVEEGGARGIVALLTPHPRQDMLTLSLYRDRRLALTRHEQAAASQGFLVQGRALVAAIDHPALEMNGELTDLLHPGEGDTPAQSAARRALREAGPALMRALLDAWPTMSTEERAEAGAHVLDHLALVAPEAGHGGRKKKRKGKLRADLESLAIFTCTDGEPRSLEEMREVVERTRALQYLPAHPKAPAKLGPQQVVIIADAHARRRLAMLFERLEDYSVEWEKKAELHRRWSQAVPLAERPRDALAHWLIDSKGLKGEIWIPADADEDPALDFGAEGRVVSRKALALPIAGAIEGAEIVVSLGGGLQGAQILISLTRDQAIYLERRAASLYRQLAESLQRGAVPRGASSEAARRALRDVVVRLRRVQRREGGAMAAIEAELLEELATAPVLPTGDDALISLETALRERPHDLAGLGLWAADTAPLAPPPAPTPESRTGPSPAVETLEALRQTLKRVRGGNPSLLANLHVDRLRLEMPALKFGAPLLRVDPDGVLINAAHALMAGVIEAVGAGGVPKARLALVASMVYTALNHWHEDITDADEVEFHRRLARDLLER